MLELVHIMQTQKQRAREEQGLVVTFIDLVIGPTSASLPASPVVSLGSLSSTISLGTSSKYEPVETFKIQTITHRSLY